MREIIRRTLSFGRGLPDQAIIGLSGAVFLILVGVPKLPLSILFIGSALQLFLFGQLYLRLTYRQVQMQAAKNRSKKSTHWAQSFIVEHLSEIRRPLQGLIGVRDVYDFNFENQDTKEYMEIVNHCSEHVVRLINRLQLYSELRSEEYVSKDIRFTLNNILIDACALAKESNPGKKIKIDQHISPKVLKDFFGNYDLMRALIIEVIDNAIRFSSKADIVISADVSMNEDHNLVLRVCDSGPGLTKDIQNELQSKFDRKASSFDLRSDGKGLGIPLIRSLAQSLSAQLKIRTTKGEGTEFEIHFRVPAYINAATVNEKVVNNSNQILIVEDDPLAQKIVSAMLDRLGYRSTVVSNGHDAVEICRRLKFGLILMDLEMPVMDGWEASQHILNNSAKEDQPIITALTARSGSDDKTLADKMGCQHFLVKPINKKHLVDLLDKTKIRPHFQSRPEAQSIEFSSYKKINAQVLNFNKMLQHYSNDMGLCQIIIVQAMNSLPQLLENLDQALLSRNQQDFNHCLHQLNGELKALMCEPGVKIVDCLSDYKDQESLNFISDLEQLNRYCDSLLKELSTLAKHNDAVA